MINMEQTRLIQRLTAPHAGGLAIGNPYSFGAGGGKLSPKAMELLSPIMRFDYMGAAEYEFGAVPEGLSKLAAANNLFTATLDIQISKIKLRTDERDVLRTWKSHPIYIIGDKNNQAEIVERVHLIATDENRCLADMWQHYKGKLHEGLCIKDGTRLNRFLKFETGRNPNPVVGWLELNNGFFFSVDRKMAVGFSNLFGFAGDPFSTL